MKKKATMDTPEYGPACQEYTLASGRKVSFVQPDLWDLASGKIRLPNVAKLQIWDRIHGTRNAPPEQRLLAYEEDMQSLYLAAQLVIHPRIGLDEDDTDAVIDRRELKLHDLTTAWNFLYERPSTLAADPEPGSSDPPVPASEGLPQSTE